MSDFQAITPLGYASPHSEAVGGFTIREITDRAMASVTARKDRADDVKKALRGILKKTAPDVGCYTAGAIDAFWSGPNQWMLGASYDEHEDIVSHFLPKFKGKASLTEQTDGWCRFAVEGADLDRLCSLICNIDMRQFGPGRAVRTAIEHIGCFVLRVDDQTIHIIGPRSSAGSLHHALVTAARSAPY